MPDYKEMYYKLFNKITDIIEELQHIQEQTEEMFISDAENVFTIVKDDVDKEKVIQVYDSLK